MMSLASFQAPNKHACLALYRAQDNAWWLAMSTGDYQQFEPWRDIIKKSSGALVEHRTVSSCVRTSTKWRELQESARSHIKKGFTPVDGSLLDVSPSGTRWLMSDPSLWWNMNSASEKQLQAIATLPNAMHYVLGALDRQGFLKSKRKSSPCGPSVVRQRWEQVFPREMAFATQCQVFGLSLEEAKVLWKDTLVPPTMTVDSANLGDLVGEHQP